MLGRRAAMASLAVAAAAAAGCGSAGSGPLAGAGVGAQPGGTMTIAVAEAPRQLDPLLAASPVDRLVARQLFEPLAETLSGPYGDVRRLPGLARSIRPSERRTLWRIELRGGVRFQDGAPLDASVVAVNAERWRTTAAGRSLLPGLVAADAPRPDLVRLFFDRPVAGARRLLASPRLGIVSPRELIPRTGEAAQLARAAGAGTGAYDLRRGAGASPVLARNTHWWGTPHGLGPALDQVVLRLAPSAAERLRLLRRGEVEASWELPARVADGLRRDPLLTGIPAPGGRSIGLERSVRGIASAAPPALSGVWLTEIAPG